jgi:hypothetical protein
VTPLLRRLAPLALLLACSRPAPPPPPPAAAPEAGPSDAPAESPAPPPEPAGPLPVPVTAAVVADAGGERPLAGAAPAVVEPACRFRVEVAVPLLDARLSLLDGGGRMVAGEASIEIGPSWAKFTFAPAEPLAPGADYALRLDGALQSAAHDGDGRAYAPSTWPVRSAGEKPPPARKASRRR